MSRRHEKSYEFRTLVLRNLGFTSYIEYLNSPIWQYCRQKTFESKGTECHVCRNATATQIHHSRYNLRTMNGSDVHDLWPLCRQCHQEAEFWPDGSKVNPLRVTQRLVERSRAICVPRNIEPFWPHRYRPKNGILAGLKRSQEKLARKKANIERRTRKASKIA